MDTKTNWDDVAQILTDAKSYLMEHGRCRKNWSDPESRVCMGGALRWASGHGLFRAVGSNNASYPFVTPQFWSNESYGRSTFEASAKLLVDQIPGAYFDIDGPWYGPIADWNDDERTGDGDVLDAFDRATFVAKDRAAA